MDIRTRLALWLVFVSLASMAILGAFAYKTAADLLQEISIRQLDALAESKAKDLEKVQEGWRDQLRLIKSRTELRQHLKRYVETGDPAALGLVVQIIEDAATAVDDVDQIRILGMDGTELAAYGRIVSKYEQARPEIADEVVYSDSFPNSTGGARVVFSSLLVQDGANVGYLEIVFDAFGIVSVTDNFTGLGETGEVMVVMKEDENSVLVLNPPRHLGREELTSMPLASASNAIRQSLDSSAKQGWIQSVDYRGVDVWAATRNMPDLGWGVIVKVDAEEEAARAYRLRDAMFDIALALSAFAIVGGTMLGFYLARPIHDLALLVERVRHGEMHLRADASGDDEIAYLAESLNELMDHMQSEDKTKDG
ncbi:MAG: HAMP domain-containing protein [Pseudomonadota bacterium]